MLDTTRRVATPEGIELALQLAGPVPRALAWTIDLLLRLAVIMALSMAIGRFGKAAGGIILITAFFIEWLLPAWFEVYWNGQTPGKRLFRLAVLNDDGSPVRWPASLTRNLLRAVDFLPFFYVFGLIAMLASRDFKRLGDLAAGTIVVHQPERSLTREVPAAPPLMPPFSLSLAEQRAVLDLAERTAMLTRERLEELAELPTPLVGRLTGAQAAAHLLGMANYIVGSKR